jgi:hypothetical protein
MYKFVTPYVEEGPAGLGPLFSRYRLRKGVSVFKYNGEFYEMRYPTNDDILGAEVFYMGGNEYIIDDAAAQDLINAGYEVTAL